MLELVNVMGRWTSGAQWQVRNRFAMDDLDTRAENPAQSATKKRYEMAQRLGMVERVAMQQVHDAAQTDCAHPHTCAGAPRHAARSRPPA